MIQWEFTYYPTGAYLYEWNLPIIWVGYQNVDMFYCKTFWFYWFCYKQGIPIQSTILKTTHLLLLTAFSLASFIWYIPKK